MSNSRQASGRQCQSNNDDNNNTDNDNDNDNSAECRRSNFSCCMDELERETDQFLTDSPNTGPDCIREAYVGPYFNWQSTSSSEPFYTRPQASAQPTVWYNTGSQLPADTQPEWLPYVETNRETSSLLSMQIGRQAAQIGRIRLNVAQQRQLLSTSAFASQSNRAQIAALDRARRQDKEDNDEAHLSLNRNVQHLAHQMDRMEEDDRAFRRNLEARLRSAEGSVKELNTMVTESEGVIEDLQDMVRGLKQNNTIQMKMMQSKIDILVSREVDLKQQMAQMRIEIDSIKTQAHSGSEAMASSSSSSSASSSSSSSGRATPEFHEADSEPNVGAIASY